MKLVLLRTIISRNNKVNYKAKAKLKILGKEKWNSIKYQL